MKIAAYLATLVVRLIGLRFLFSSGSGLLMLIGGPGGPANSQLAVMLVLQFGLSVVGVIMAGRVVRLFTADAPLGNE